MRGPWSSMLCNNFAILGANVDRTMLSVQPSTTRLEEDMNTTKSRFVFVSSINFYLFCKGSILAIR